MNTSRRGDETEATILSALMRFGLSVSVPFGDSDRYDMVVDDEESLYRVQYKTGNWVNGSVRFNLYSSTLGENGRVDTDYTPDEIDAYAVYSPTTGCVYWVPSTTPESARCDCASKTRTPKRRHHESTGQAITYSQRSSTNSTAVVTCIEYRHPLITPSSTLGCVIRPGWCSGPSYDPVTVVTRVQIPPRAFF